MPFKIVFLDDEVDLCTLFKLAFETEEVSIKTFSDADEAIHEVKNNPPDLIFLDYRLVGTTGDVVAQRLGSSIPLVLVTGELNVSPQTSFVKIIKKPYKYKEMQDYLQTFLQKKLESR